ncbi:pyridoxamine 5'-phosphate oxidase family protein [Flavobacterium sp.]|uniref:pyridoxamine 5'-phosphate oxidase family protein n=1 Tax=Flavobacterium sp. TaxID=239 RepID=UPI00286B45CE|nr:pyridoxamine 5'-phosphate oxidase family protein [Flavobacterium sp.]
MSNSEKNIENEGVKKLIELVDNITICFFCTDLKAGDGATATPMSAQKVDEEGNIWFFSGKDSDKNKEISKDKDVQLFFSHPGKSSYVVVNGEAEIVTDIEKIKELYTPAIKIWFKEGVEDPNISLIKVATKNAYYWDTVGGIAINCIKMIASVVTGKNLVEGVEGNITV